MISDFNDLIYCLFVVKHLFCCLKDKDCVITDSSSAALSGQDRSLQASHHVVHQSLGVGDPILLPAAVLVLAASVVDRRTSRLWRWFWLVHHVLSETLKVSSSVSSS